MLSLSRSVGYAIRALGCLEAGTCETRHVRDIATCANIPPAYLAKIFKRLIDAGILKAKRGTAGGTRLARPAKDITVLEIAEAIDGAEWLGLCLLGYDTCSDARACPTHEFWKDVRQSIQTKLREITLVDVIAFECRKSAKTRRTPKPRSKSS